MCGTVLRTEGGHARDREAAIIKACIVEWSFRPDDFYHCPVEGEEAELLRVSALGTLYGGEVEAEAVGRLERAVWRANGGMCHVDVDVVAYGNDTAHTYRDALAYG